MTWPGDIRRMIRADFADVQRRRGALTDSPERPEREDEETKKREKKGREE
jgi:hypothetical protein